MKYLMSKEHYCYKIHALLMKSVFPPSVDNLPNMNYPHLNFYKKIMIPLLYFFNNLNPTINKGGLHYG